MKFPSLSSLFCAFADSVKRFPLPFLFALTATVSAILLVNNQYSAVAEQNLVRFVYLGNIGLAMSVAIKLAHERNAQNQLRQGLTYSLLLVILAVLFFVVDPFHKEADILVLVIIAFAAHLLVSIAAFHQHDEAIGFWQINKLFFLRFAASALYSAVLFIGISVALLSINQLFKVDLKEDIYAKLWILTVGIFNTSFFLAGIPRSLPSLNEEDDYPKGLKIFTQFVLIPLATTYLLILLAYEVKILIDFELPNSSVAVLILGYAVFGILSLLLVHPLRHQEGNAWIRWYSKRFYLLMLPLIVLLILAIYKRVGDYGITESRYVLIALCVWLSFITVFFLIKGQEQIRMIPISLVVICTLIVLGPWRLTRISKISQQSKLEHLLGMKLSEKRNEQIRSVVTYLNKSHGIMSLQPFIKADLQKIKEELNARADTSKSARYQTTGQSRDTLLALLNIPKYSSAISGINDVYYFKNESAEILDTRGAEKIIVFNANQIRESKRFWLHNQVHELKVDSAHHILLNGQTLLSVDSILRDFLKLKKEVKEGAVFLPATDMSFEMIKGNLRITVIFDQINGGRQEKREKALYFSGYLLVKAD